MTAQCPLIIGEVLFDEFPDGQRVLGGAPFNVAWNLQGFGLGPLFVSAVGRDDEGAQVRATMDAWEMDTGALQTAAEWPTGKVHITLENDEPQFSILDQQAYDEIQPPDLDSCDREFSLLYLGSLAYRSTISRATTNQIIGETNLPRFVDINIRQPWFDKQLVVPLLHRAEWVKLNADELSFLTTMECSTAEQIAAATNVLRDRHGIRYFFVTCGASGAYVIDDSGEILFADAPTPNPFMDAVGAGDAFASAVIAGIARGLPLADILAGSLQFASNACTIRGATTTLRSHYSLPFPTD
ncbi:MAG: PfkB family carbohydrate kinase [Cyanobacteria bacterium P01_F01_bin.42]